MKIIRDELSKASVISVVLGLVLLIWPGTSVKLVGYGLGGAVIVYGAVRAVRGLTGKQGAGTGSLIWGLIMCLIGVFICTRFSALISFLPFIFGVIVLVSGLTKLSSALENRRQGYRWIPTLLAALISIGLGVMILCRPFSTLTLTLRVIGAVILVDGAENLIEAWLIRRRMKEQGYLAKEGDNGIIDIVTDDDR